MLFYTPPPLLSWQMGTSPLSVSWQITSSLTLMTDGHICPQLCIDNYDRVDIGVVIVDSIHVLIIPCKDNYKHLLWFLSFCSTVWYFISKNQPGLRHSDPLKSSPGSHSLLVSNSVVAACFFCLHSRSASCRRVYIKLPLLLSIHLKLVTALDYS